MSHAWRLRCMAALVLLSPLSFTSALAQSPNNFGYCYGLAGNPRVENFTRVFLRGPSTPQGQLISYFITALNERYKGFTTQENDCPMFASAADASAARKKLIDQVRGTTWPPVEIDWLPAGTTPQSELDPSLAPGAAASKKEAPATDPAVATCREVTEHPASHANEKVTVIGLTYVSSMVTIEGKQLFLQVYACADAIGTVPDYDHLFAVAPKESTVDPSAATRPAQKIEGVVQPDLEVPMQNGRIQVKRKMVYLSHATIRGAQ